MPQTDVADGDAVRPTAGADVDEDAVVAGGDLCRRTSS